MSATPTSNSSVASNKAIMLKVTDLFCERDDRILFQHLMFELGEGGVLQVQGSNGSGKTTLLRILCGLHEGYEGEIQWYGAAIKEQAESFFSSLLYIGHRVGVNKVLTPLENLRWSCGLQQQVTDEEILQALAELGLRGYEESQCFALSAGQQQRVSLARLLISPARLWVLDEPFTTLDSGGVVQLEKLMRQHAQSGGSVLVTTHHQLSISELDILSLG